MSALLFYKGNPEKEYKTKHTSVKGHVTATVHSPDNDDDKIQHIPPVSHIGVLVHHQSVSDDLEEGFNRENDQEGIFYRFLWNTMIEQRDFSFQW